MDPRTALAAYRTSCRTYAQQIKQFLAGREGLVLAYNEAVELDDMVGALVDQIDGMEDTWEAILEVIRQHSINTHKNALLREWSRLVESTRRIVDRVLKVSDRYHVALPVGEDSDLDESEDELYFSAREHEDLGVLDNNLGAERVKVDINGACQWVEAAEDDVTDENAEFHADGDEDRHVTTEVVQSWTGLNRGVLEKALEDRWNCDPGMCFCTPPGKHPEPAIVPEGSVKSQ